MLFFKFGINVNIIADLAIDFRLYSETYRLYYKNNLCINKKLLAII